jgi:hypothetical protein
VPIWIPDRRLSVQNFVLHFPESRSATAELVQTGYRGVDASGKPLKAIPYKELDLDLPWQSFDIAHELTNKGIRAH